MNSQNASFDNPTQITLPLAVVTVGEMGAVSVTVDGDEFRPPNQAEHWTRTRFGELLDALTLGRKRTVRIEVHEIDGSIFTDIIHAVRKERVAVNVEQPNAMRRARHRPAHQLFEITGSGFIPGEDVTVALGVSSAEGSADGKARGLVDLSQLADHRSEIMLIGRVSGVIVSERLPS
ncbi:hypothetical protein [Leucobacter sp. G161]|uniref:hypothetical protein n=1 Tax=Leucobacter sp. G161 TaxID=663704 RepID=UPI0009F927E5|nr:hypothetical protein [Leucobacter sp. G161]